MSNDNPGHFGSRVIGKARAAEQKQTVVERRTIFGSRVLGTKVKAGTNTPAPDSDRTVTVAPLSLEKIRETLEANPNYVVALAEQEFARPKDTIRLEALRVFKECLEQSTIHDDERERLARRIDGYLERGADNDTEKGAATPPPAMPPRDAEQALADQHASEAVKAAAKKAAAKGNQKKAAKK